MELDISSPQSNFQQLLNKICRSQITRHNRFGVRIGNIKNVAYAPAEFAIVKQINRISLLSSCT